MSLKVEIENIGGLFDKSLTLEKGVNRIRAPNALGKTSFTKALELLTFSEAELRGKGHYSNLFVGSEEPVKVGLSGDMNHERSFKRIGDDDLKEIGTEPLVSAGGKRVIDVCFAVPGNNLIEDFLNGRDVKSYVELLAGSENYDKALGAIDEITSTLSAKIQDYHDSLIRIEEYKRQEIESEKDLEEKKDEFSKMPIIDEEDTFKDYKLYIKKKDNLDDIEQEIASSNGQIQELTEKIETTKQDIKWYESQIQLIKSRSPRINARLTWIASEIPTLKKQLNKIKTQRAKAQDKLSSAQRNEVSLTKYGDEGLCYACGKRMTKEELSSWIQKIKKELSDLNTLLTKTQREIEDLLTEQTELKEDRQELARDEDKLKSKQKSLANREDDKKREIKEIKKKENKVKTLLNEIHGLSSSEDAYDKFKERQDMKVAIDQKEVAVGRIKQRIDELSKQTLGLDDLQDKYDFIQKLSQHLESRRNQIEDEVRKTFDKQVTELYKKLGYKDFDDIEIGPDFRVSVTRKKDGRIIEDFPLDALSTSERITIAIAFLIAAKTEYVRDFPFFVLDEIITSYDPERFKLITDYLKTNEDYVIITELADDTTDVEVVHDTEKAAAQ